MIYTSYFSNWRQFPEEAVIAAVTRFPPKSWKKISLEFLAPSVELLDSFKKRQIDEFVFKVKYLEELKERGLTPEGVREQLEKLADGHDIILCCYEKPEDFCHRHILAKWLGDVEEL